MEDFEQQLKQVFLDEAQQIAGEMEEGFLVLESSPDDQATIERIFRLAHNLKGSSKAVGFDELGHLTHEIESFLLKIKSHEISITHKTFNLLLLCKDQISLMVAGLREDLGARFDCTSILTALREAASASAPDENGPARIAPAEDHAQAEASWGMFASPSGEAEAGHSEHDRTASGDESQPLLQPQAPLKLVPSPTKSQPASNGDESIRIKLERLEHLIDFVGEVVILQTVLREQANSIDNVLLRKTIHQLGKVTKEVQDITMSLRMIPLRQTFQKMQRIVRDTSGSLGKSAQLILHGEETDVDKTILEKISDPLVHLIRNAVDHGLESPDERAAAGKPELGSVTLSAFHQGGKLYIKVGDDGRGMDPARLREKAVEKGLLSAKQNLSDKEALQLIFMAGFSTKAIVSDVSGRGVGMDVVKTNIETLQGEVLLESELGKGSCITIVLPLTMAIIDGMIVRTGSERYVLPLSQVHESLRIRAKDIQASSNLGPILTLRGEPMPLYRLGHLLGRGPGGGAISEGIAIVVRTLEKPFAIVVDDIIGQRQVVIKKLGDEHQNLVGVSGSAILGDGRPSLILEVGDLVRGKEQSNRGQKRWSA